MKIGIFSDVHGYINELKQTLNLLGNHHVDQCICVGDLVDKGQYSDAAVELMIECNIACVQGNHDAKVGFTWLTHQQPMQQRAIEYLTNLPLEMSFEWGGVSAYMSHCNPWQDTSIYVYPTRPMALFKMIADAVEAKVIILGHTHMPMRIWCGEKLIINPGAVYGNVDSDSVYGKRVTEQRTCGILSLPECQFDVYDISSGDKLPV